MRRDPEYDPGYPPEYDHDPVEEAERLVKEVDWALMNWETGPGPWGEHVRRLKNAVEELLGIVREGH